MTQDLDLSRRAVALADRPELAADLREWADGHTPASLNLAPPKEDTHANS